MFGLFKRKAPRPDIPLYLFNTAENKKEVFVPLKNKTVTMYSCGPTVYDYVHIGNLRSYVFSDTLKRALEFNGFHVQHTINLTDFGHLVGDADAGEDKMMIALRRAKKPITLSAMREVAEPFIASFKHDLETLNVEAPSQYSRASDYVKEQIALIQTLEDKGYTYETSDGIYFDISKFPAYGKLGNINIEKLKEGARVEQNTEKRHPADFALWKKGMLGWDSRWGKGFPGWHIECTAMAFATLGKQIDIHTGGIDHIATHHNGEIAQAESITKKTYVNYWVHNAFITIDDSKIAKSVGNGIGLKQLKDKGFSPEVYRYWLLTGHYRSPMNFTFTALEGAKQALYRLKRIVLEEYRPAPKDTASQIYVEKCTTAINDDLDTPKVIAYIWDMTKDTSVSAGSKFATLQEVDQLLGLRLTDSASNIRRTLGVIDSDDIPGDVQILLTEREAARAAKDWAEADRIREEINLKGYTVEDMPEGVRLSKN